MVAVSEGGAPLFTESLLSISSSWREELPSDVQLHTLRYLNIYSEIVSVDSTDLLNHISVTVCVRIQFLHKIKGSQVDLSPFGANKMLCCCAENKAVVTK